MTLDPETLLGIKSEVLKAAVSASLLGVLWRRQFKFAEAVSSLAAGLGSAVYVAPLVLSHTGITHPDIRGGVIFIVGLFGTHVFAALTTAAPDIIHASSKGIRRVNASLGAGAGAEAARRARRWAAMPCSAPATRSPSVERYPCMVNFRSALASASLSRAAEWGSISRRRVRKSFWGGGTRPAGGHP